MGFDPTKPPSKDTVRRWPGAYHEALALEMAFQFCTMVANENIFNGLWTVEVAREHIIQYMRRFAEEHTIDWPVEIRELVQIRLKDKFTPGGV